MHFRQDTARREADAISRMGSAVQRLTHSTKPAFCGTSLPPTTKCPPSGFRAVCWEQTHTAAVSRRLLRSVSSTSPQAFLLLSVCQ